MFSRRTNQSFLDVRSDILQEDVAAEYGSDPLVSADFQLQKEERMRYLLHHIPFLRLLTEYDTRVQSSCRCQAQELLGRYMLQGKLTTVLPTKASLLRPFFDLPFLPLFLLGYYEQNGE
ncbi:MAG: hypothetical protein WAX57_02330 [Minisyncoccia bacterium]